jgi:cell division protein FtsN
MWLFTGILIGLGMAWYLAAKGYIPQAQQPEPVASERINPQDDEPVLAEDSNGGGKNTKPRYDFFTVLPEMEVVVPEQELNNRVKPKTPDAVDNDPDSYLLQVGSFKSAQDADQMKAQLALTGISAKVQSVTVNDATWHRVRVGPVKGARAADDMRRRLQNNGIDSLVMKSP